MKGFIKKLLSLILCMFLAFMAVPLANYLDAAGDPYHDHHECTEEHDHDHTHNKGFIEKLFSDFFPSAHAASTHTYYSNSSGCRTHVWCNWGCHDYDTYNHVFAYGNCIYCGASNGHVHSYSVSYQSGHPHAVYCYCSCGYSYTNGYLADPGCLSCYPCVNHSWSLSYHSNNGNGTHQVGYYCTRCLATTASTEACSLSYSGITPTGGGTHKVNSSCSCGYTTSTVQACSGGKATVTAPAYCSTCGQPYGIPDPCANGHNFYAYYCEAAHPHANYDYCLNCAYKQYDGTYRYKSNCKQCNPDLVCQHTAETWQDTSHPHTIYCRGCSEVIAASSYLSTCPTCNAQGVPGSSGVLTIWAATNLTSVNDSGVLSIEHAKEIDDYFTYGATAPAGDSISYISCSGPGGNYSGGYVSLNDINLGTYTITAMTAKGATRTIMVTIKTQSPAIGDIRFRTIGMNIKEISGDNFHIITSSYIKMEGASIIPASEFQKIASLIGKYDGKTYTILGSLVIEVYNVKTSKILGTYDVLTEYGSLTAAFAWGQSTISDFRTMQNTSIAYQAPKQINATATYCSQDKSRVFGTVTAQQIGAPQYLFPYETYSAVFTSGMVAVPADWEYHGAQWVYNPQGNGYTSGSAAGQTSIGITFTSQTPTCSFYFYWKETKGSISVTAVDSTTGTGISNATVLLGGQSGGNGKTFTDLPFGTYTASASAPGYSSGSGSATISSTNKNAAIVIPLTKIPTHGNLTVTVRNSVTNAVIPNASVICEGISKTTNSSGMVEFNNILPGTYSVTASAGEEYDSSSVSASIVAGSSTSITIYLTPSVELRINPIIEGSGQFRKGSTVIVAATFTADRDIIPAKPANVNLLATYKKVSGSSYVNTIITSQNKTVIVPKGEENLVWFELTLPESGYYRDEVTFQFTIAPPDDLSGEPYTSSETIAVIDPVIRSSPQTKFEKAAPSSFLRLNRKNKSGPTVTWNVWEWESGSFAKRSYSAALSVKAALTPDETAGFKAHSNDTGLWTTRSGYGLNTALEVGVTYLPGMIAGTAKADVFYPEFNYSASSSQSNNLLFEGRSVIGGNIRFSFSFQPDQQSLSKNKLHKTPVWFPDGEYTINYEIFDLWTPGGELTATDYAIILIDGNMYDDSYAKPLGS